MTDLAQLQQRVERAERRFGALGAEQGKHGARLVDLMDRIEQRWAHRQQEIEVYVAEIARLKSEYDQVKAMLQDLLLAIEAGGEETLAATMQDLANRAAAIVGEEPAEAAPAMGQMISFPARFEDVSAGELDAETVAEHAAAVEAASDDTETAGLMSASPVAEIIERIGHLTRALVDVPRPLGEEPAADTAADTAADAPAVDPLRRSA